VVRPQSEIHVNGHNPLIMVVMPQIPFHLRYDLTRWQRLIPHLGVWGPMSLAIPAIFVGIISLAVAKSPWWTLLLLPVLFIFRGFFVGLLDVILRRVRNMDILVEDNALRYLAGDERWYLFLDGIIDIAKYRKDVWTIQHWNGSVVNVLASEITDDQIEYIKAAAERGRTPEGIQAVIERGRVIQQIEAGNFPEDSEGQTDG
jgi:hypothetical protein